MLRYNHRIIEREMLRKWAQTPAHGPGGVCVLPVPRADECSDLENARLLTLADFFCLIRPLAGRHIHWLSSEIQVPQGLERLGLSLSVAPPPGGKCQLAIISRDFAHFYPQNLCCEELVLCGRFFGNASFQELLADFGADALRVYFLYLGPLRGDYRLCWHGLAAAYRFVERVWLLAQDPLVEQYRPHPGLQTLQSTVQARLEQKKPHTALAAVMGFLKGKRVLTSQEVEVLAIILKPYAPFLAAEMFKHGGGDGPKLEWPVK